MQILGNAFGVPDNTVRTYAEAEIRAGYDTLVYQLICCSFSGLDDSGIIWPSNFRRENTV